MSTTNPNYETLLAQIAAESDPIIKASLIALCYQFLVELTEREKELFEYCDFGYIANNPGIVDDVFSSYVGVYFSETGEKSG